MEQAVIEPRQIIIQNKKDKEVRFKNALHNPLSVIRSMNDQSLYYFTKCFWDQVSQDKFQPNWHIELFCREAEKIANNVGNRVTKEYDLVLNVPPGTTKTKIWSVMLPVWCWTKWYWMQFITGGYSSALSLEAAEQSRDIMRSARFKLLYPELDIKQDKDTKSNFRVVKREYLSLGHVPRILYGGNRFSTSVGGTATGMHGHLNILDDPLNPQQAASETELATANRWIDQTMSTRKTDKRTSVSILVMQRLHEDDPSGHILAKNKKNIRHICLPGQIVDYKEQLKPAEFEKYYVNGLLDPVRMSWDILKEMEADLGQYGFSGQVGQKPTPPGGGMFKVDHFQVIMALSWVNVIQSVRYWDKAGTDEKELKKGRKAAYTAGVLMHQMKSGKWIVSDVKRGHWASEEREQIIRETAEADGRSVVVGVEQEPGSGGKESAQGTVRNLAGFNIFTEHPTGDKAYRADPYSVQVNSGNVLLVKGDWNTEYVREHENFPFSTYKDQVDASSGCFNYLTSKKMARRIV